MYIFIFLSTSIIFILMFIDYVEGSLMSNKKLSHRTLKVYFAITSFQIKMWIFFSNIFDNIAYGCVLAEKRFTKWEQKRLRAKRIKKIRMERLKND